MLHVKDSVAVITGGSGGIGKALAEFFRQNIVDKIRCMVVAPGYVGTDMFKSMDKSLIVKNTLKHANKPNMFFVILYIKNVCQATSKIRQHSM
jgi:NAD(P)-dependent dehydrogenase (short-subunit alcohol dehydrogenase family)